MSSWKDSWKDIEQQVLQLPPVERRSLAETLFQSIEPENPSDVESEWGGLAEKRWDEIAARKIVAQPTTEVSQRIRTTFGW